MRTGPRPPLLLFSAGQFHALFLVILNEAKDLPVHCPENQMFRGLYPERSEWAQHDEPWNTKATE